MAAEPNTTQKSGWFGGAGLLLGFIIGYLLDTFVIAGNGTIALIAAPIIGMFGGIALYGLLKNT